MWQLMKSNFFELRNLGRRVRGTFFDFLKKFFSREKNEIELAANRSESAVKMKILFMGKDALWYKVLQQALESKSEVYQSTLDELNGAAARRRYDLIVVDTMELPENKIRATISRLKKQQIGSHVVLASASPTWEPVRVALKAGASDYITKSYDPDCVAGFLKPYLQNIAKSSSHEKN
jgi:DNA-binding response OmpR family regulator